VALLNESILIQPESILIHLPVALLRHAAWVLLVGCGHSFFIWYDLELTMLMVQRLLYLRETVFDEAAHQKQPTQHDLVVESSRSYSLVATSVTRKRFDRSILILL